MTLSPFRAFKTSLKNRVSRRRLLIRLSILKKTGRGAFSRPVFLRIVLQPVSNSVLMPYFLVIFFLVRKGDGHRCFSPLLSNQLLLAAAGYLISA